MKTFEEFADEVRVGMKARYDGCKVDLRRVTKNNGVLYTGVVVVGADESIYPTLYLESFYDECDGELTDELLDRMCNVYESRRIGCDMKLDYLKDYESVKKGLRCKLINRDANKEMLKEVPHRDFLDLAIVPYYQFNESGINSFNNGMASFTVRNSHLVMWGVDEETVIDDALEKTYAFEEPSITGIFETLRKLNPVFNLPVEEDECPMYVMTTEGSHGAISMIFEQKLKDFCERINCDVLVLPSSTMEVILVPAKVGMQEEQINAMIREINITELDPVSVLSDHAYYFGKNTGYKAA